MSLQDHLTAFRENFDYTRCHVNDDNIVYSIPIQFCSMVCKEANDLIEFLGLPLIAKSNQTNALMFDSVIIEPKP